MIIQLKVLPLIFIAILFFGCPFHENRQIEKLMSESELNFHNLYNQNKFQEIYSESDKELKEKFTEKEFVSYLELNKIETGNIENKPMVWINDELSDGIKRVLNKRTRFSNVELTTTEKAIYRERFEWNFQDDKLKIAFYSIEKICNKPCQINIKTK